MNDPFDSLVVASKLSSSQEDLLRFRQFCRESQEALGFFSGEESSQPDGVPVASTGILICSPPESLKDENTPPEEFQTPPEESLLISSDEQRIDADKRVGPRINGDDENKAVDDDSPDLAGTVDLGRDTDLGFFQEKSPADKGLALPRTETLSDMEASEELQSGLKRVSKGKSHVKEDESKGEALGKSPSKSLTNFEKILDLQSQILNLLSPEVDNVVDAVGDSSGEGCAGTEKACESLAEENIEFLKSKGVSPCNSVFKSPVNLQKSSTLAVEGNNNIGDSNDSRERPRKFSLGSSSKDYPVNKKLEFSNPLGVEVISEPFKEDSALKATEKDLGLDGSTEKVSQPEKLHCSAEEDSSRINTEAEETFKFIDPSSFTPPEMSEGLGGRRELPLSMRGLAENVDNAEQRVVSGSSSSRYKSVMSLKDAINMVSGEKDLGVGKVDLLETAKRRGMTFPQPRWWLPGGN